jgi:hypothetical protein
MTTKPNPRQEKTGVLEDIRANVYSLKRTGEEVRDKVEEMADKVDDCLSYLRYDPTWYDDGRPAVDDAY